jgi:hypothetical protein
VAELLQLQAVAAASGGVLLEEDPCPVVAQAGPAGVGADITGRGAACGRRGTAGHWCEWFRQAGAAAGAGGVRSRCPSRRTRCRRPWTGRARTVKISDCQRNLRYRRSAVYPLEISSVLPELPRGP